MSVAPDGSPVEVYLALSGVDEAHMIDRAIPASADVLDLGCGVGRIAGPLAALGYAVTAVDNSAEMLAAVPGGARVETILAEITSLDLGRRFGAVLLASQMINSHDGSRFLLAAARHLADDGVVLVQRHVPGWIDRTEPEVTERSGVTFELTGVSHAQSGVVTASIVYTIAGRAYRQRFTAYEVDDQRMSELAAQAGLSVAGYADGDPSWVILRRA